MSRHRKQDLSETVISRQRVRERDLPSIFENMIVITSTFKTNAEIKIIESPEVWANFYNDPITGEWDVRIPQIRKRSVKMSTKEVLELAEKNKDYFRGKLGLEYRTVNGIELYKVEQRSLSR